MSPRGKTIRRFISGLRKALTMSPQSEKTISRPLIEALEDRRLLSSMPAVPPELLDNAQTGNYEAEMQDVTNPVNAMQVAAVVMIGNTQIYAYNSLDGGKTWAVTNLTPLSPTNFAVDPAIAYDANGNLFVAAIDNGRVNGQPVGDVFIFEMKYSPTGSNPFFYSPASYTSGPPIDKDAIATGYDPVNHTQALYFTASLGETMPPVLEGWDIDSQGNVVRSTFMQSSYASGLIYGWGPPMVDAAGNVYLANTYYIGSVDQIQIERLPLGLWHGQVFDAPVVVSTSSLLGGGGVPAAPERGIGVAPQIRLDASGTMYLTYMLEDPGFQADGPNYSPSPNPTTEVYVQTCAAPATNLNTWTSPVAIDPESGVTQFHPIIAADPTAPHTVVVEYRTTDRDPAFQAVKTRVAVSSDGGVDWSHADFSTATSNMWTYDQSHNFTNVDGDYREYEGVSMYNGTIHGTWSAQTTGTDGLLHVWAYTASAGFVNVNTTGSVTIGLDPLNSNNLKITTSGGTVLYDDLLTALGGIGIGSTTTATITADLNDTNLTIDNQGNLNLTTSQHLNNLIIETSAIVTLPGTGTFNTAPL